MVYFCWFFDQFAASHPLISPDGNSLVFAGHMTGARGDEHSSANSVYLAPLAGGAPARRVAPGHFACWDTSLRDAECVRVG